MPLWVGILILFGGLLVIGVIVDLIAKLRGKKINFERKHKTMNESERITQEKLMNKIRDDINDHKF